MSDWLSNIRLHHESVDWTDASLDAAVLSKKLMGPCPYLAGLSPEEAAKAEIQILKTAGYPRWGLSSKIKPYYQHFLTLMKLLMPQRDVTLNLADAAMFFCKCLTFRRKGLHLIGSQSSSKSTFIAMCSLTCLAIAPRQTACYVANPFDAAADSTVWGEILSVFNEIMESTSPNGASWLWPDAKVYKIRSIEVIPGVPKAALIELRGVKEAGKFKGMKDVKGASSGSLMMVAIDEVNEIKSLQFVKEISNLVSQEGFLTLTSQNFTTEDNMGGIFCRPKALYEGCPDSYSTLDKDRHQFWHSHLNGVTLRFNGLRSPNILAGRTIYPYLFTQENLKLQLDNYGEDSPEFYSQVLSFPRTGLDDLTVLSTSRRDSSRWKDKEWVVKREDDKVGFCDPSFGGGDKAMWGFAHFGTGESISGDGKQREQHPLFWFSDRMVTLRVTVDAVITQDWLRRCRNVGIDISQFVLGDSISPEEQVAVQCAELNLLHGIKPDNFGFDFSMRPETTPAMRDIVGRGAVAFDYLQSPEGYWLESAKQESTDRVTNRVGELAFLTAELFLQRQLRGGRFCEEAVTQLTRTRYQLKGKKLQVEAKRDYKARNQGHSPDERDVLMGLVGMAYKRGFRPSQMAQSVQPGQPVSHVTNKFLTRSRIARLPTK